MEKQCTGGCVYGRRSCQSPVVAILECWATPIRGGKRGNCEDLREYSRHIPTGMVSIIEWLYEGKKWRKAKIAAR